MNEIIFTKEMKVLRLKLRDKKAFEATLKYYPPNVRCGLSLLKMALNSITMGEDVLLHKIISKYLENLNGLDEYKYYDQIIEPEINEAIECFIAQNENEINSLPKVHKNNKKILYSFIRECIIAGLYIGCETTVRLLKPVENDKIHSFGRREVI